MDPASLMLNAATALTAALTLLFSRLDSRHQRATEQFDLRTTLWDLSYAVDSWEGHAHVTNSWMQRWAQGLMSDEEAARAITGPIRMQVMSSEEVLAMLHEKDRHGNLRHLLKVYGPEVLEVLETGFGQRRAAIDDLAAKLPQLRAGDPEIMQATMTRLESTMKELSDASARLDEYLRVHFFPA